MPKRSIIAYRPVTKIPVPESENIVFPVEQPYNLNIICNGTKNGLKYPLVLGPSVTSVNRQRPRDGWVWPVFVFSFEGIFENDIFRYICTYFPDFLGENLP